MRLAITSNAPDVEELYRRAPAVLDSALMAAMNDSVTDLHVQMQTYPPQRSGSTYERRNILRASWIKRVRRQGGRILGEVVSSGHVAPYNIRVQSAHHQARVHRGIWTNTDRNVMQRSQQRINGYFRERIRRAVASLT